ncbi:hypothetical protein EUX98_g5838 [Antrodiella citrinella]|uniref:Uncharacterized protein n=1 Tax=Antrodiella citrinella TaxID=2447956 RepID=A0A4S4MSB2_9APHY|nr:hypothetical protein EUX98_g5838 [Antrodiella citrinella]
MKKIRESASCDRIHLEFNNGKAAVVRIPTPLVGPPHLAIASEVAAMDFLRRLPVHLKTDEREAVEGDGGQTDSNAVLTKTLRLLADLRFKYHGSIYYKEDVSEYASYDDFLLDSIPPDLDISPFVIGPCASADFWEADRATLPNLNRDPWTSTLNYVSAAPERERRWLEGSHAKPSLDDLHVCVIPTQTVKDNLHTLDWSGRLWYGDLALGSISTTGPFNLDLEITSLNVWINAVVVPAYLNLGVPTFLQSSNATELPVPLHDTMTEEEFTEAMRLNREADMHQAFEVATFREMLDIPKRANI